MRDEISIVAGVKGWGDTRESWLAKVPKAVRELLRTKAETVPYRMVKALWYGEIKDLEHHAARDVRRAAEIVRAQNDARALAEKYQTLIGAVNARNSNSSIYGEEIARLERVARLLCGGDRP